MEIYKTNFLTSPFLRGNHRHQILPQHNFPSAAKALNTAIDQAENDLLVFAHQDVFFPEKWLQELERALDYLERIDPLWGVLGCYGVTTNGQHWGYVYSTGQGILGGPFEHPMPVQTLDEIVLVLRKTSGLRFDDTLPHFHFYGTDICMTAASKNRRCYAIPAFCIHNTNQLFVLPKEFYENYGHIKKRWKKSLPIKTSCITVENFDVTVYKRKIKELVWTKLGKNKTLKFRVKDPEKLLEKVMKSLA